MGEGKGGSAGERTAGEGGEVARKQRGMASRQTEETIRIPTVSDVKGSWDIMVSSIRRPAWPRLPP